MTSDILLAVVIGILALFIIHREWTQLTTRIGLQEERIAKLEQAARLRMPHKAVEDILDAMAALDKEQTEMKFHLSLSENIKGHLINALSAGTKREKKENEDV